MDDVGAARREYISNEAPGEVLAAAIRQEPAGPVTGLVWAHATSSGAGYIPRPGIPAAAQAGAYVLRVNRALRAAGQPDTAYVTTTSSHTPMYHLGEARRYPSVSAAVRSPSSPWRTASLLRSQRTDSDRFGSFQLGRG